jgi:hypothetical protein
MAKTIQIVVVADSQTNNPQHNVVQGSGDQGKPTRIKAVKGAHYQLKDPTAKDIGPDYIRSKRVGKNLDVSLYGSKDADLIIEDYYANMAEDGKGLYGMAENGEMYEYIPEDPTTKGLTQHLVDGNLPESQVLGGVPFDPAFVL